MRGAPIVIKTKDEGLRQVQLTPKGSVGISSTKYVEHLENSDDGLHQWWSFDRSPRAEIVVALDVSGLDYVATTETGVHFVDPETGVGVRYSHATWIDSSGRSAPIVAGYARGEITLTVAEQVVLESTFPAVLDPTVSAELDLDIPTSGPAVSAQYTPDIAYSPVADAYFAVWSDYRREDSFTSDVFGARIDPNGVVLDAVGLFLTSPNYLGSQVNPEVAYGGDYWMVVGGPEWRERRVDSWQEGLV